MHKLVAWISSGLLAAALVAGAVVLAGGYDVAATTEHWQWVYSLLETTMRQSVQRRARELVVPAGFADADSLARGAACFREHCLQCHGAPGVARGAAGLGQQPLAGPLEQAARDLRPHELYWIVRHGVRMSGMPAWEFRLGEADLWAVTGFVTRLPQWSPAEVAARLAGAAGEACTREGEEDVPAAAPDAERGRRALYQYACNACHTIPGVVGSARQVGPPLAGIARRGLLPRGLANTPDNLAAWLRHPKAIDPQTAMPELGVSARDARDMAAYLGTLD